MVVSTVAHPKKIYDGHSLAEVLELTKAVVNKGHRSFPVDTELKKA